MHMNETLRSLCEQLDAAPGRIQTHLVPLYPGITLCYVCVTADTICIRHELPSHVLQVNHCRAGQLTLSMHSGSCTSLNPGDFSLQPMRSCTDAHLLFPTGAYQGLSIFFDWPEVLSRPPAPLADTGLLQTLLPEAHLSADTPVVFPEDEHTQGLFSGFYDQPDHLMLSYQRVKVLELLLLLAERGAAPQNPQSEFPAGQLDVVREIHDQLLQHMDHRITIDELSRQYLINPTTLKAAFKAVYGTSLAAHIKEHRMEQAAKLLKDTDLSIAEIAQAVGYDSPSKFTAAFKAYFQILPRQYRRR